MSRRVPLAGVALTTALAAGAVALFLILNSAFGGPEPAGRGNGVRVTARLPDGQGVVTKSLVMVRGVRVGDVASVQPDRGALKVTLAVDPARAAVFRDAAVRIGHRTLFGEAYVDLDPGHARAGRLVSGATLPDRRVRATVELDEALKTFDRRARRHIRSLARTGAAVASDPRSAARLNRLIGSVSATVDELRTLGSELHGQREHVAGVVANSRAVVEELSGRDDQLRTLVSAGMTANEALTADQRALRGGLAETSALLRATRPTLRRIDPLLVEAEPVLDSLVTGAPATAAALRRLPSVARSTRAALAALPAARRAAVPTLHLLRRTAPAIETASTPLLAVLRNLVPALRHLAPYGQEVVGFISANGVRVLRGDGTADAPDEVDLEHKTPYKEMGVAGAPYLWARFFVESNSDLKTGTSDAADYNPYAPPADPYSSWTGRYPRLSPTPPPEP